MASILRVNTLTDASSNNSTAMSTINQGTAKAWVQATDAAALSDSFNISGGTDNGTGDYTTTFSTNMGNTTYAVPATMAQDASVFTINKARATSSVRMFNVRHDNVSSDKKQCYAVFGDLA